MPSIALCLTSSRFNVGMETASCFHGTLLSGCYGNELISVEYDG